MMNWSEYEEQERKHERCALRRIILGISAAVVLAVIAVLWMKQAKAEPMAQASVNQGQVVITLYTEDCALTNVVTNLPKRATWKEGGKVYEGCVGVQPQAGVAMLYFAGDKTVAVVPLQLFARVTGA